MKEFIWLDISSWKRNRKIRFIIFEINKFRTMLFEINYRRLIDCTFDFQWMETSNETRLLMLNYPVHLEFDCKPKVIEELYQIDNVLTMLPTKNNNVCVCRQRFLVEWIRTESISSKNFSSGFSFKFRRKYCNRTW